MQHFEQALANQVIRHKWIIIAAATVFTLFAAAGLSKLKIDSDLRVFFADDDPRLQELESLEHIYTKTESIIFVVTPKQGDIFQRDTLNAILALTEEAWRIPFSSRVDSITNYQYTRAEGDELFVSDFVSDAESLTDAQLENLRQSALDEPLLVKRVLSKDAKTTGIFVNAIFPDKKPEDVSTVANYSRDLRTRMAQQFPQVDFYVTGSVMFDMAFSEIGQHDMSVLAPIMFLLLVVVVGLSVRSFVATFTTMIVVLLSMLSAMGLAGWLGISINPASANAPTIILTLAVADSVHILVTLYRLMHAGESKHTAIIDSFTINFQAVLLTSITTAVGFLTMNFSESPPFHDLGNIVAIGITLAFFYSILLLPALMSVLPVKTKPGPVTAYQGVFNTLADFVIGRSTLLIITTGAVVIFMAVFAVQNQLNDNWIGYFDESIPVRASTDVMEYKLSGSDYIDYSIPAQGPGAINEPEYFKFLEAFADYLREQPEVVHVYVISDLFKRFNKNMHGDDQAYYRIPDERNLAAQLLLMYEMSLPLGLDLNNQINVDKSASRVLVTVKNKGTRVLRDLDMRAQEWLLNHSPEYMHTRGSGLSIVWAYLSERNIISMLSAAFGALIVISFIMLVALRRVDIGIISLIPNLTPALVAFGIWHFIQGEVGLGLSVVIGMTLGIVVDDSVHFISKYLRFHNREGASVHDAIRETFHVAGPAMAVTTIALVIGFLVLTFSDYKMSADMGLLTAITVAVALVMDFLLLPAILVKWEGWRETKSLKFANAP